MDIQGFRKDYQKPILNREALATEPLAQFERWFKEACDTDVLEPNAMTLSTVNTEGQPSSRTVLLKFFDQHGFVFYTNYKSRKAHELAKNNRVALLFPWIKLARQVAITGVAEKISAAESARYFSSRPRESQLGAWISRQSSVLSSRQMLMLEFEKIKNKFSRGEIPLPDFWGGYRVRPQTVEFWQGQTSRLHDRFLYTLDSSGQWSLERLAP
nr:pyridoxamine 5'-phosphate oxidase [uncultured Desulfobulbus sp.]